MGPRHVVSSRAKGLLTNFTVNICKLSIIVLAT